MAPREFYREPRVRTVTGAILFVVGVLSTAACLTFMIVTIANPYNDVTRAWTTIFAVASGAISVAAWIGAVFMARR